MLERFFLQKIQTNNSLSVGKHSFRESRALWWTNFRAALSKMLSLQESPLCTKERPSFYGSSDILSLIAMESSLDGSIIDSMDSTGFQQCWGIVDRTVISKKCTIKPPSVWRGGSWMRMWFGIPYRWFLVSWVNSFECSFCSCPPFSQPIPR